MKIPNSLGFDPAKIVYDSPVKTTFDLERAIRAGVHINLDNLDEVDKVNKILSTTCAEVDIEGRIGIRKKLTYMSFYGAFGSGFDSRQKHFFLLWFQLF